MKGNMGKEMKEDMKEVVFDIQELLLEIGIPANFLGFAYIVYAVHLSLENQEYAFRMSKQLYMDVAKFFGTTQPSVERCIRHAIITAWTHGNTECIQQIFKNSINPKKGFPTNSQFITSLCLYYTTHQRHIHQ